jgi:hypothetical protein
MLIEKEITDIMDDNKRKALQAALSQIEKQFGKGSIMRLGQKRASGQINTRAKHRTAGVPALNAHTGGGLAEGNRDIWRYIFRRIVRSSIKETYKAPDLKVLVQ